MRKWWRRHEWTRLEILRRLLRRPVETPSMPTQRHQRPCEHCGRQGEVALTLVRVVRVGLRPVVPIDGYRWLCARCAAMHRVRLRVVAS